MNFKLRKETKYFCVVKKLVCKDAAQLYKEARRRGDLDTGYHYIVDSLGNITTDRPSEAVAGWNLKDNEVSVYVLVDANKKLNDSQKLVVHNLQNTYYPKTKYKEI